MTLSRRRSSVVKEEEEEEEEEEKEDEEEQEEGKRGVRIVVQMGRIAAKEYGSLEEFGKKGCFNLVVGLQFSIRRPKGRNRFLSSLRTPFVAI
ncbi:unnamed protein product [Schistocephalus solidus]|uniref:Uncharacterized protein n=1 Tax=Schistocephalus solidus TaxID=70667 RepID=A0A183SED0_SCHSO|nr:unnamed protein product [Schistocephalus solidus]